MDKDGFPELDLDLDPMDATDPDLDLDVPGGDFAALAKLLELDSGEDGGLFDDGGDSTLETSTADTFALEEAHLQHFAMIPRDYITRTIRSEVIDSLVSADGDVRDPRFLRSLQLLEEMFKSTVTCQSFSLLSPLLNSDWKSISRPEYHHLGCLGANERGDDVYTLGKITFNMFKPTNLRVTVQSTMNSIRTVCDMGKAPTAAPWSMRREIALRVSDDSKRSAADAPAENGGRGGAGSKLQQQQQNPFLKSYDIAISLTIEPGQFKAGVNEDIPSPPRRLRATQIVRGYFLPDPDTPNRLSVWFTGGKLSFAPTAAGALGECPDEEFGTLQDWIDLFGAEYKRTWGEALSVIGAKLFLGASLPEGMESDGCGSMSYSLNRPYGGHGKGYVDVLYLDNDLLITRGQTGIIHAMVKST